MSIDRSPRIVLNFAARCALHCEWCYVPFGHAKATPTLVAAIVDRIASLGFTSITFGGGDPFQYSFLWKILKQAKDAGLFVHVDTHGKGLTPSEDLLTLLHDAVDLLGLPVDGPNSAVHDAMRSTPGHFALVRQRLIWLHTLRDRLKINTLLSARNLASAEQLGRLVASIGPSRWSIYQYWPLGPARGVEAAHRLSSEEFQRAAVHAAGVASTAGVVVEVTREEDRRNTYPIVRHDGVVLVHTQAPQSEIVTIGSIFDSGILERIQDVCVGERSVAIGRYTRARLPGVLR